MEFSLLSGVDGFEKVILFYVFSCGLEKIALIGSKNGQTPDFTVVSILLTRTLLQQIFIRNDFKKKNADLVTLSKKGGGVRKKVKFRM